MGTDSSLSWLGPYSTTAVMDVSVIKRGVPENL
jgi:hypothetical protein